MRCWAGDELVDAPRIVPYEPARDKKFENLAEADSRSEARGQSSEMQAGSRD